MQTEAIGGWSKTARQLYWPINWVGEIYIYIPYIILSKLLGYFVTYSQVHKYWDIDTILIFLALYTTTMDFKWNEQDVLYVQTFSFNLRVFSSKSGEWCRNYNSLYVCSL